MTPAIVLLEKRGIDHEVVSYDHDPAAESYGGEVVAALGLDPAVVFKTLVADVAGVGLVVAVVPVSGRLDLKALAKAAGGKKASMADPANAERSTGYVLGGISPLGQKKPLPTVIDSSAEVLPVVHVSAGRRGLEVALSISDLAALTGATIAPISN